MTTKIRPRKVHHVPHGTPEFVGDSKRAILLAERADEPWIDINFLLDRDGKEVATHYKLPMMHGFHDPLGRLHPRTRISDMTPAEWGRLRAKHDGKTYRINDAETLLPFARKHGRKVEFEPKCRFSVADFQMLGGIPGTDPDELQVKIMATLPIAKPWLVLRNAKIAEPDRRTILLVHERGLTVPASAQEYIDHYRGFEPIWV